MTLRPWAVVGLVAAATACAYYNGLYNANRLASDARRAEREGRSSEARSLWTRAAIKAESVATRFPNSKYRDDALLLQGRALHAMAACTRAVDPLGVAADSSPDAAIARTARLLLARCRLMMFEPESVAVVVEPVVAGPDSAARAEALWLRGRAALAVGNREAAIADLTASTLPEAVFPRAIALARFGRPADGAHGLAAMLRKPYREDVWLATLDTVGRVDPAVVGELIDRLVVREDLGTGERARLLLADGERWQDVGDSTRARGRFHEALDAAPDSIEGRAAQAYLTVERARYADDLGDLASLVDTLRAAMRRGGQAARIGAEPLRVLQEARYAVAAPGEALRLFVAAEAVRDTLRAAPLAAALFVEVARRDSGSVLAPKALLAAAALRPNDADSLLGVVHERYAESVYALALRGMAGDAFRAVEDSLYRAIRLLREGDDELVGDTAGRRAAEQEIRGNSRRQDRP